MSRTSNLLKSSVVLFVAKAATQFVSFVLLPVYTAVLSTEEYGEIDLYTTAAMIILPFITLQLEQAAFRYLVGEKDARSKSDIITTCIIGMSAAVLVVGAIYLIVASLLGIKRAPLVAFYYLALAVSTMLLQICRGFGDNLGFGIGSFLVTACSLVLSILFVVFMRMSVDGALVATALANLLAGAFLFYRSRLWRYLSAAYWSKKTLFRMLRYSTPLIFNQVSSWAVNYSNRLVLLAYLGMGANGVFAVASKFSNVLSTIYGTYNLAWTENMVFASGDEDYEDYASRMTTMTMKGYVSLVIAIMAVLPFLFPYLVNKAYWDAYDQIPFLLVGMFFSGMAATLGSIYIAHERTTSVAVTTCAAGASCVAINLLFVRWFGLYSASVSNVVSFGLMFFYRYFKMREFQVVRIGWRDLAPELACLGGCFACYFADLKWAALACGLVTLCFELLHMRRSGALGRIVSKLVSRLHSRQ